MELQEFTRIVVDRSHKVPVVVDFWAPWCGPCRVLGPVIEELAKEADNKWELIKINVDESQEVAGKFNIMSIPTVMLFIGGKPKDQFAGALPKYQINQWLTDHLPDPRKDQLASLQAKIQAGMGSQALTELEEFVSQNPDLEEARLWLAREKVCQDPNNSESLIEDIKIGHKLYDQAEDVRNLIEFFRFSPSEPSDISVYFDKAKEAYTDRNYDQMLAHLVNSMMRDKSYGNELARRVSIAIFHTLGESHALTKKHRPKFSMALY